MSVYVDNERIPLGRMKICHMMADTEEELHNMADTIGIGRHWFQNRRVPHYDICRKRRAQAIRAGAVEIDRKQTVELIRRHDWLNKTTRKSQVESE